MQWVSDKLMSTVSHKSEMCPKQVTSITESVINTHTHTHTQRNIYDKLFIYIYYIYIYSS